MQFVNLVALCLLYVHIRIIILFFTSSLLGLQTSHLPIYMIFETQVEGS